MRLDEALSALGLPRSLQPRLLDFEGLFQKWNRNINLSAARTEAALRLHVVDSLHIVPHLRRLAEGVAPAPLRILDVGAGGGLPAVVAAICLPGAQVTALEPVHKKHAFLRTAARELELAALTPLAIRLDDHDGDDYDAAMSRATFDLADWLALGLLRVRSGGTVFGFEALVRPDLPAGATRFTYNLGDRHRTIVSLSRLP
jgi:16S rRNA (guanine527-N7)-methyltransferase